MTPVPHVLSANKSFCLLNSHPNQPFRPPPQGLTSHSPFVIPEGSKLEGFLHASLAHQIRSFRPFCSHIPFLFSLCALPSHNGLCSSSNVVIVQATGHFSADSSLPRLLSQLATWYSSACPSELIQVSSSQCDLKFKSSPQLLSSCLTLLPHSTYRRTVIISFFFLPPFAGCSVGFTGEGVFTSCCF